MKPQVSFQPKVGHVVDTKANSCGAFLSTGWASKPNDEAPHFEKDLNAAHDAHHIY